MKLIRLFIGFVAISLILGLGGAFNGNTEQQIEQEEQVVENQDNTEFLFQ